MKLVRSEELIHAGGVTYDAYVLQEESGEVTFSTTRVGAEGTEFYIKNHPSFQKHWKQVGHYYFRIARDTVQNRGYYLEFRIERQFNAAPQIVDL